MLKFKQRIKEVTKVVLETYVRSLFGDLLFNFICEKKLNKTKSRFDSHINLSVFKLLLTLLLLFGFGLQGFSQNNENQPSNFHFKGNISANHNGISLIPSFSLGRPAFIFELSLGGERLTFDPEIRFAMDGKPWSFVLWSRYKLVKSKKFNLRTGVHPAFVFREIQQQNSIGTGTQDIFTVDRYFAGELAPSYNITKNFKVGAYYLHGLGLDPGLIRHNHFIGIYQKISLLEVFIVSL